MSTLKTLLIRHGTFFLVSTLLSSITSRKIHTVTLQTRMRSVESLGHAGHAQLNRFFRGDGEGEGSGNGLSGSNSSDVSSTPNSTPVLSTSSPPSVSSTSPPPPVLSPSSPPLILPSSPPNSPRNAPLPTLQQFIFAYERPLQHGPLEKAVRTVYEALERRGVLCVRRVKGVECKEG
ncbi:hypothetical protein K474DRAFT_1659041 [Panus rudis PR-1116 ss-1]|nr:hypothetical protein K474DRAFT_1659041 [Panus rudis PR-1116 ss-1]